MVLKNPNAFAGTNLTAITVGRGRADLYRSDTRWASFAHMIR